MSQSESSISKQAEKYAEVIVGQIAGNFNELRKALKNCTELKKLKITYDELSPNDTTLMDIDKTKKRLEIIENSIGDLICDKNNTVESLAVGLFGEWGSGKTYQLKLIEQRIKFMQSKEYAKQKNEKNKVCFPKITIPIFFNAWRFEKEEHIILPLFQMLLDAVEQHDRTLGEKSKRSLKSTIFHLKNVLFSLHKGISLSASYKTIRGVLTNNLEDMRELSNIISLDPVQKNAQKETDKEQVGEQSLSDLVKPDQLDSIYLNIPQWIEKITLFENVNFVFLIDDLDRCLPENTLKMLESIKLFLDVPSCAFVLAVDDDVVERGVVHHYRDYLSIYHHKDTDGAKSVLQHELPITGHEYLEKMIQLPIRLPVIDTVNVREFLEEHSSRWIEVVDRVYSEFWGSTNKIFLEELDDERRKTAHKQKSIIILDFFANAIPAKPRKIKRTAKLFETKLQLFDGMKIECHEIYMLIAKVTLLELFAPKLLRFIQNNGYDSTYNRLVEFKEQQKSLTEFSKVDEYIRREDSSVSDVVDEEKQLTDEDKKKFVKGYYTQKEQQIYVRMMDIVKEHYTSRIQFDLDEVFTKTEDQKDLQKIIEMRVKEKSTTKEQHQIQNSEFLEKLLKPDDVQSWRDAFKVDKLFEEGKATLTDEQLQNIMKAGIEKGLYKNHEWRDAILPYITPEQLKEELYFEMMPTTVTRGEFKEFMKENVDYKTDAEKTGGAFVYDEKSWNKKEDASWKNSYIKDETDEHPVVCVSWNDAKVYIAWMNERQNEYIYALPSKAEWEFACNLGKDTKWHFGDDESQLEEYAWYSKNSKEKTYLAKSLEPNALKLYNMHGNVWEWCKDWYAEDKRTKVLKGGSWLSIAQDTQTANTSRLNPHDCGNDVGFRLHRTKIQD